MTGPGTGAGDGAEARAGGEGGAGARAGGEGEAGAKTSGELPVRSGAEWYQQPLGEGDDTADDPDTTPPPLTPGQAFDALYAYCALPRTADLSAHRAAPPRTRGGGARLPARLAPLAGGGRRPRPGGLGAGGGPRVRPLPWHRLRPVPRRHHEPPPADPTGRALLTALLELPPPYRRTLVLYDGVGLDLPDTAAETESSTPAAAGRLLHARATVTERLPKPVSADDLSRLLAALPSDIRPGPTEPLALRERADLRARRWIHAAIAFTTLLLTTTALTLHTAPDHYERPVPPGAPIHGIPRERPPAPSPNPSRNSAPS